MNVLLAFLLDPEVFLATNPPLFYVLAKLVGVLGIAEPWLRIVPLLSGVALVELTRRLALELGLSRAQALVAAALVVTSPLAIEYATDFSHYAPVAALTTLSFLLLLRALRSGRAGPWHAYFTCMVLGFYTHYVFLVLGLAHTLYVLWFCWMHREQGGRRCLLDFTRRGLVAALFVLPWLPVFFFSVEFGGLLKETTRHYYQQAPSIVVWLGDMLRALAGLPPRAYLLTAVPLALWLVGGWQHRRLGTHTTLLLVLPPLMLLVHVLSMYHTMTSFLEGGAYYPFRYGLPLVPLLAVPTALALASAFRGLVAHGASWSRRILLGLAVLASLAWLAAVAKQDLVLAAQPQRPDLEETAHALRGELQHGDALVVVPAFSQAQALAWYLFEDIESTVAGPKWSPLADGQGTPTGSWIYGPLADISFHPVQMELAPSRFGRVVVVSVNESHAQRAKFDHGRILEHLLWSLEPDWTRVSERTLPGVQLLVLEPADAGTTTRFVDLLAQRGVSEE